MSIVEMPGFGPGTLTLSASRSTRLSYTSICNSQIAKRLVSTQIAGSANSIKLINSLLTEWTLQELNLGPAHYECAALPTELSVREPRPGVVTRPSTFLSTVAIIGTEALTYGGYISSPNGV